MCNTFFARPFFVLSILLLLLASNALAFEQNLNQIHVRGTNNAWSVTPMVLVDDNTWMLVAEFGASGSERFKFDVNGDWSENYGDSNADGTAENQGNDIPVTDGAGNYEITFNDSTLAYTLAKSVIAVENIAPVANAGADISILVGEFAQFDGSGSTDSDGTIASYVWSNGLTGPTPSMRFDVVGQFAVMLTVTDNLGASHTDEVIVNVTQAPTSHNFSQLFIRGTNNDWNSTALVPVEQNIWQIEVTFGDTATERFKFDVQGDWSENYGDNNADGIAELSGGDIVVSEGAGQYRVTFNDSSLAYTVAKLGGNIAPVANAGADINVLVGEVVTFDGSASFDADGTIDSFDWSFGLSGVAPTHVFTDAGTFSVSLTVTDNQGATNTDTFIAVVVDPNAPLQSNFSQLNIRGTNNDWASTAFTLVADFSWQVEVDFSGDDARFKFDVLGDWSENYGDDNADGVADLAGGDIFISAQDGRYRVTLNDLSLVYSVERIGNLNIAPIADAGADLLINIGDEVVFDTSESVDLDGELLTFSWSNGMAGATPSLVFDTAGDFIIELTVTDEQGLSDTDSIRIVVADIASVPAECFQTINFLGDVDQDGLPDCAELPSVPYLGEQYYLLGARVDRRDLFVEVDWMDTDDLGVVPQIEAVEKVRESFARQNIGIHFDLGPLFNSDGVRPASFNLGGGSALPFVKTIHLGNSTDPEVAGLLTLKTQHMSVSRQTGPWYYVVFGSSRNLDGSRGSSGVAEISGRHSIVSLGKWGLNRDSESATNRLINYQAGTLMHEFGHVLGLRHGGFENRNRKPNYLSVMSYDYQLSGLPTIGNNEGDRFLRRSSCPVTLTNGASSDYRNYIIDYSHGLSIALDENGTLVESQGFGHINSGGIDWNCDGDTQDVLFSKELNADQFKHVLEDHDDWGHIEFIFFENNSGQQDDGLFSFGLDFLASLFGDDEVVEHSLEPVPSEEFFERILSEGAH